MAQTKDLLVIHCPRSISIQPPSQACLNSVCHSLSVVHVLVIFFARVRQLPDSHDEPRDCARACGPGTELNWACEPNCKIWREEVDPPAIGRGTIQANAGERGLRWEDPNGASNFNFQRACQLRLWFLERALVFFYLPASFVGVEKLEVEGHTQRTQRVECLNEDTLHLPPRSFFNFRYANKRAQVALGCWMLF